MAILEQYLPSDTDTWTWYPAKLNDIPEMVGISQSLYQCEIENVFTPTPALLMRSLAHGIINQNYDSMSEQMVVARDNSTKKLLGWAWLGRGGFLPYAPEEFAEAKFVHLALDESARTRIHLTAQILQQWVLWCQICQIPVLVSTTIREDQRGFMRLHESAGFIIRGSFAYYRVS